MALPSAAGAHFGCSLRRMRRRCCPGPPTAETRTRAHLLPPLRMRLEAGVSPPTARHEPLGSSVALRGEVTGRNAPVLSNGRRSRAAIGPPLPSNRQAEPAGGDDVCRTHCAVTPCAVP